MSDLPVLDVSLDEEGRFYALALRYLDGLATTEEEEALSTHLRSVPDDRRRFVTLCRQVGMLYETLSAESSDEEFGVADDSTAGSFPVVSIAPSYAQHSFGSIVLSYAVSAMILCVALLGAWAYKINHDRDLAVDNSRRSTTSGQHELVVVGRITGMKNCHWSDLDTQTVVGASVSLNRRYALASGLLEITYETGAKVILEGPCTYKIESSFGGYLAQGKLTANIRGQRSEVRGRKSEHSSFAVKTPTAVVTDLGTEFGVEVAENGDTTSYVFQGVVKVEIADGGTRKLTAGESVLVEMVETQEARFTHPTSTPKFVRRLYEPPKILDLLDIVAGGDGTGKRRECGIDPSTGNQDTVYLPGQRTTIHPYSTVDWNSFVDGVFIPKLRSMPVSIQLDSAGHVFNGFTPYGDVSGPPGRTAGSIWARAAEVSPYNRSKDRWHWIYSLNIDERFMPERRGVLSLQSNAGITFDLEALRRTHKDVRPARFRATAGIVDAAPLFADKKPHAMADLWVFVDGKIKQKRMRLQLHDEVMKINVSLGTRDRFLTLAVTDSANGVAFDWVVFGDPILETTANNLENQPHNSNPQIEHPAMKGGAADQNTTGISEK